MRYNKDRWIRRQRLCYLYLHASLTYKDNTTYNYRPLPIFSAFSGLSGCLFTDETSFFNSDTLVSLHFVSVRGLSSSEVSLFVNLNSGKISFKKSQILFKYLGLKKQTHVRINDNDNFNKIRTCDFHLDKAIIQLTVQPSGKMAVLF